MTLQGCPACHGTDGWTDAEAPLGGWVGGCGSVYACQCWCGQYVAGVVAYAGDTEKAS